MHYIAGSILLVGCSLVAGSQGAPREQFVIEAGDHDFIGLIESAGAYLGHSYSLDKAQDPRLGTQDGAPTIQITKRLELDARGCEEVVSQLAFSMRWVRVPLDRERGVYDWISLGGPRMRDVRNHAISESPEEVLAGRGLQEYVMTTLETKHVDAQMVAANLRGILGSPMQLTQILGIGGPKGLVLTGMRGQVAAAIDTIRSIDTPERAREPNVERRIASLERRLAALEKARK